MFDSSLFTFFNFSKIFSVIANLKKTYWGRKRDNLCCAYSRGLNIQNLDTKCMKFVSVNVDQVPNVLFQDLATLRLKLGKGSCFASSTRCSEFPLTPFSSAPSLLSSHPGFVLLFPDYHRIRSYQEISA